MDQLFLNVPVDNKRFIRPGFDTFKDLPHNEFLKRRFGLLRFDNNILDTGIPEYPSPSSNTDGSTVNRWRRIKSASCPLKDGLINVTKSVEERGAFETRMMHVAGFFPVSQVSPNSTSSSIRRLISADRNNELVFPRNHRSFMIKPRFPFLRRSESPFSTKYPERLASG